MAWLFLTISAKLRAADPALVYFTEAAAILSGSLDAKGKSTLKSGSVTLNSVNDAFDGKFSNFTFDSTGKISNFKVATSAGKSAQKVSDRIFSIKQSVTTGAMFVTGGFVDNFSKLVKSPDATI